MSIERITGKQTALDVANRWHDQYFVGEKCYHGDKRVIHERLLELGPQPECDAVDAIIGNRTWTSELCVECGEWFRDGFRLGEGADYDSATVQVCDACARKYVQAMQAALVTEARKAPR